VTIEETAAFAPQAWESFYVIVGSTAGALTGLQFVVLTLISDAGMVRGTGASLYAFGSPNVVHFCAALLVSAILSAPWHGLGPPGVAVLVTGACGFVYCLAVLRRALRQSEYQPVLEDWIWHAALPLLAYGALVDAGIELRRDSVDALFIVGGATLLLMFIGIHNAWDTVTYVTLEAARKRKAQAAAAEAAERPAASGGAPAARRDAEPPGPPT